MIDPSRGNTSAVTWRRLGTPPAGGMCRAASRGSRFVGQAVRNFSNRTNWPGLGPPCSTGNVEGQRCLGLPYISLRSTILCARIDRINARGGVQLPDHCSAQRTTNRVGPHVVLQHENTPAQLSIPQRSISRAAPRRWASVPRSQIA